jgi:hypothetical protein
MSLQQLPDCRGLIENKAAIHVNQRSTFSSNPPPAPDR